MTGEAMRCLNVPWHVVVNDVVGGWSVIDTPGFEYRSEFNGTVGGPREICDCWDEMLAREVVVRHNEALRRRVGVHRQALGSS